MPILETKAAASASGFGGVGSGASSPVYIEDVFSTWLYTGNGTTQTITNGIDLSGKGGLVWIKRRDTTQDHALIDTARANGASVGLATNSSSTGSAAAGGFLSTGFSVGNSALTNASNATFASWTFREQPDFFDVVTFSTDSSGVATFSHSLGSTPGCIFIKRTSGVEAWYVYHRSLTNPNNYYLQLNATGAETNVGFSWITVSDTSCSINGLFAISSTYVAYLFAHNAGGFGLSGTDNVISCGSFTTDGSNVPQFMSLGYEPQWMLWKRADGISNWEISDSMRGMPVPSAGTAALSANLSNAEDPVAYLTQISATGNQFSTGTLVANSTYIYIAIRRGPMKVPTSGTSVYNARLRTGTGTQATITGVGFSPDLLTNLSRSFTYGMRGFIDRLRGPSNQIRSDGTAAEASFTTGSPAFLQDGYLTPNHPVFTSSGETIVNHFFRRAPGFFDEVCYTGDGVVGRQIAHNLGAVPELMIIKARNNSANWGVYYGDNTKYLYLQTTAAAATSSTLWNNTSPTTSVFTVGGASTVNVSSAYTYVAYLFATCAGVSKVGSYTGTGALQTIDCGFTGGARFVLIKRTDSTGDWYVYDSARGIVAGSDPYLTLNTTAAEVTTTDWVDTYSAGFELSNAGGNNVNINGATYIFLSVA